MSDDQFTHAFNAWSAVEYDEHLATFADAKRACESPIEELLLAAFLLYNFDLGINRPQKIEWGTISDPEKMPNPIWSAVWGAAQRKIGQYKVDFVLIVKDHNDALKIVVECDGHEFHEKTKIQAARDKRRDRFLQSEGWLVLRFTGAEIHKNPIDICAEINDVILKWIDDLALKVFGLPK